MIPVKIYKRGDWYWLRCYKHPITGCDTKKSVHTKDIEVAEQKRLEWQLELTDPSKLLSFEELIDKYFVFVETTKKLRSRTLKSYKSHIKVLKPYLRNYRVSQIDTPVILDNIVWLIRDREICMDTANRYLAVLSSIFEYAKLCKYIKENPVRAIKPFKVENKKRCKIFTIPEYRLLVKAASIKHGIKAVIITLFQTGMRPGEAIGLRKEDLDFYNKTINIERSHEGPTKTGMPRKIGMPRDVEDAILEWWEYAPDSEFVFPSTHPSNLGGMRTSFKTGWHAAVRRSGIDINGRTLRDARHTFITWLLSTPGNTAAQAQAIGGWSSLEMIDKVYGHVIDDLENLKNAMGRMEF